MLTGQASERDNSRAHDWPLGKKTAKFLLGLLILFGFLGFLFPFVFGFAHDEPPSIELYDHVSRFPPRPQEPAGNRGSDS